ncbi:MULTISPECIES: hypothetical protein [Bradyrhizobium]|jgi:hypothetical protein|uniref:Uncharacterized protein n=1 Tax=Bradyrhizobium elkanii TaxID=29448 RepID=A0ABV4EUJ9_BRAEL|nr:MULTISPECIES: hypothetical protein [Bradyrhizobium]MCP1755726.1 hypothetical protein [Bradyrhizobium elkanii]MCP1929403.1 hypothetical protein [Bradyrhizobium elkanii]MCP1981242.1 hypothetical protein [Bradyrhizobium elkanii]MCS3452271.1 hypothetical protein [Bradyrhizobium elkanii]MCS3473277.1 hypothetical protein [Bradyrhizobium elkanii]
MDPSNNINPSAARTCFVEPQHEEAGQADFQQQLGQIEPIHQTAAPLEAGSSGIVTDGNKRARAIQGSERCAAESFVRTRAQLAATLTCANVGALGREIELAAQQAAKWPTTTGPSAGSVDRSRIFDDRVASSYAQLQRFQDDAAHCKPHALEHQSATDHLRFMASLRYEHAPWNIWGGQRLDLGRTAAGHMRGDTNFSPFVSLSEDASRLLLSPDDANEYGAKAIAENANELHTYTVPRAATWTSEQIVEILEDGTENDEPDLAWVSDTPIEEREVLFLGGNLDDYRTASEPNPYKKPETEG